jgi:putative transcriptional regulator
VVIHGIPGSQVDKIAAKIAEIEHVPLIATVMPMPELILALRSHDLRH